MFAASILGDRRGCVSGGFRFAVYQENSVEYAGKFGPLGTFGGIFAGSILGDGRRFAFYLGPCFERIGYLLDSQFVQNTDTPGHPAGSQTQTIFVMSKRTLHTKITPTAEVALCIHLRDRSPPKKAQKEPPPSGGRVYV